MTLAPASEAARAVMSVDPSSTTTSSYSPQSSSTPRSSASTPAMDSSSSQAGIITLTPCISKPPDSPEHCTEAICPSSVDSGSVLLFLPGRRECG
ncbi:MAG: hypothetical protein AO394_06190 [Candidatus Fermentibacter daniensis]|nr:MAG: hypothetical protein AO394_06190 [Candidatus Fermentibacter daniensis]